MKALEVLKRYGYTGKNDKVYLQCFDFNELKRIKTELMPKAGMDLKLVQLIAYTDWQETFEQNAAGQWVNYSYDWMFRPEGMKEIAKYADGIGPQYPMLIDKASTQGKIKLTGMGHAAHANGLVIHPYTLRKDALPAYAKNMDQLLDAVYNRAQVDGAFSDFRTWRSTSCAARNSTAKHAFRSRRPPAVNTGAGPAQSQPGSACRLHASTEISLKFPPARPKIWPY